MSDSGKVVPFGKYRGQPVEALQADRDYVDWLLAQAWFRERYQPIYQIIVNNFGEANETPEHNRLQARFLDEAFCRRLLAALQWLPAVAGVGFVNERRRALLQHGLLQSQDRVEKLIKPSRDEESWWQPQSAEEHEKLETKIAAAQEKRLGELAAVEAKIEGCEAKLALAVSVVPDIRIATEFEFHGWDVRLGAVAAVPEDVLTTVFAEVGLSEKEYLGPATPRTGLEVLVELKPALGDDYPAILRQMKANRDRVERAARDSYAGHADHKILVFDQFTAAGADAAQVVRASAAARRANLRHGQKNADTANVSGRSCRAIRCQRRQSAARQDGP